MRNPTTPSRGARHFARRVVLPGAILAAALVAAPWMAASPREAAAGPGAQRPSPTGLVELGRRLFFEPQASPSRQRACAACHLPEHGFSDPAAVSRDDFGATRRHSQTILDAARQPNAHWDGEFKTIEELVTARLETTPTSGSYGGRGRNDFGVQIAQPAVQAEITKEVEAVKKRVEEQLAKQREGGPRITQVQLGAEVLRIFAKLLPGHGDGAGTTMGESIAQDLGAAGRYDEAFRAAFGSSKVTLPRIALALGAYCRSVVHTESPYDRFKAGEEDALGASARRGLALFEGRARCSQCHVTAGESPALTDYGFHNSGVAFDQERRALSARATRRGQVRMRLGPLQADTGREGVSGEREDLRKFKTPTLRDVARRGPYMHDGSLPTLAAVVRYYAAGCGKDPEKDARLEGFEASDRDVADLVAFLEALSGSERPGLAKSPWAARPARTRLRLVDANGVALSGLAVQVKPFGDVVPSAHPASPSLALSTDGDGWIEYAPTMSTHARLVLPDGPPPRGGDLVPDSCRRQTVVLPVVGRATLTLLLPTRDTPPEKVLLAFTPHVGAEVMLQPQRVGPTHVDYVRRSLAKVKGRWVARYEGWVPAKAGPQAHIASFPRRNTPVELKPGEETRVDLSDL